MALVAATFRKDTGTVSQGGSHNGLRRSFVVDVVTETKLPPEVEILTVRVPLEIWTQGLLPWEAMVQEKGILLYSVP